MTPPCVPLWILDPGYRTPLSTQSLAPGIPDNRWRRSNRRRLAKSGIPLYVLYTLTCNSLQSAPRPAGVCACQKTRRGIFCGYSDVAGWVGEYSVDG
eukprot:5603056-Pyramimonas_sp.AAC.2